MPEFPISSARILLVSQIQGGGATALPAPLSGTPMNVRQIRNVLRRCTACGTICCPVGLQLIELVEFWLRRVLLGILGSG